MTPDEIGGWLVKHDWSPTRLADELGVSRDSVERWLAGRYRPPAWLDQALATLEADGTTSTAGMDPANAMPEDVSSWLPVERERIGLTREELAKELGAHPAVVEYWERGWRLVHSPTMLRLALEALAARATKRQRRAAKKGA